MVEAIITQGHIKFENVSFRYDTEESFGLSNVDVEIQPGQTVALVGRAGSGKSTLANLLMRSDAAVSGEFTGGKLLVDGHDITSVSVASLRSQISAARQHTTLLPGTIRENISTMEPQASLERVIAAAKLALAHDFISALPMGYDTVIGETGKQLSDGQRQRIGIARAIVGEPSVGRNFMDLWSAVAIAAVVAGVVVVVIVIAEALKKHSQHRAQVLIETGGKKGGISTEMRDAIEKIQIDINEIKADLNTIGIRSWLV